MNTEDINKLLDLGREKCGSDYAMAKHIETSRATLSDWRKGRKKMPAADVALVANIAGLDAVAWCARAVAEGYTNRKGDLIRAALKKALEATGAVIGLFGTVALEFTQCIFRQESQLPKRASTPRISPVVYWYPPPARWRLNPSDAAS